MSLQFYHWKKVEEWLTHRLPEFSVEYKKHSKLHRFVGKVAFFMNYMTLFTATYPDLWMPDVSIEKQRIPNVLQHEAVHLIDQATFFDIFPNGSKKLNSLMFYFLYFIPQVFSVLSILAIFNIWWILCLAFLAPLPSPFRMISELRGYRRSRELGVDLDKIEKSFTTGKYYFMWPFKRHIRKLLMKDSPYKKEMDLIYED